MNHTEKERAITTYFNMWLTRNFSALDTLFAPEIYYSECYGPEYCGLHEIHQWIDSALLTQTLLEWKIKRFIHANSTVVVKWFFSDGHGFDGVSIIEFSGDGKISSIKEFESKSAHITPYR